MEKQRYFLLLLFCCTTTHLCFAQPKNTSLKREALVRGATAVGLGLTAIVCGTFSALFYSWNKKDRFQKRSQNIIIPESLKGGHHEKIPSLLENHLSESSYFTGRWIAPTIFFASFLATLAGSIILTSDTKKLYDQIKEKKSKKTIKLSTNNTN